MSETPLTDALELHLRNDPDYDALVKLARQLERQLRIAELKNRGTLANNLCPDHRDKQTGKPCLACTIETLERHATALAADLENEESRNLAQSKALRDWRAFCEEHRNG